MPPKTTTSGKKKRSRSRSTKAKPKKDAKQDTPTLIRTLTDNKLALVKCSAEKIQTLSCIERLSYYYVQKITSDRIEVMNEDGESWGISKRIVRNECINPDEEQIQSTQEVSQTVMAQIMQKPGLKQVQFWSNAALNSNLPPCHRTFYCRPTGQNILGRSQVRAMLFLEGKGTKAQTRLVDHRMIRWIIAYEGKIYIRYNLKKQTLKKLDNVMAEVIKQRESLAKKKKSVDKK